jgi:hypothetical protein
MDTTRPSQQNVTASPNLDAERHLPFRPLTIRKEQLAVFSRCEVQKFEDWILFHIKKCLPEEYEAGEPQLRETIQSGIERAARYGFKSRRDACKFIDLMLVLGRDFDQMPWARAILSAQTIPEVKMLAIKQALKKGLLLG